MGSPGGGGPNPFGGIQKAASDAANPALAFSTGGASLLVPGSAGQVKDYVEHGGGAGTNANDPALAAEQKAKDAQHQLEVNAQQQQQQAQTAADNEEIALARRQGYAATVLTTPAERLAAATGQPRTLIGG